MKHSIISTVEVLLLFLSLALSVSSSQPRVRTSLEVQTIRDPDQATWGLARTITEPEALRFRWSTQEQGARSAVWSVASTPFVPAMPLRNIIASGKLDSAPLPDHVSWFSIDFNDFLPPTPPQAPRDYYVQLQVYDAQGRTLGAPSDSVKITYQKGQPPLRFNQSPAPSVGPLTPQGLHPLDPQITVGHKYVLAVDTGNLAFYDKSTGQWLSGLPANATELFQSLFEKINEEMALPLKVCNPSDPSHNNKFNPQHPNQTIPGCVEVAYDTRVFYDAARHRFWIASAVRHPLWHCPHASSPLGADIGDWHNNPDGTVLDPDPADPTRKTAKCHHEWDPSWAHRFIAVAVSQVNAQGQEDLNKPFHKFVLMDEYKDWPQMTVNDNYLILNHRPSSSIFTTSVFDAESLANGEKDNTVMKVKPVATFAHDSFVASRGSTDISSDTQVFLVNTHGTSNRLTYLVSGNGHNLLIFALSSPPGNPSGKPTLLKGAAVLLDHVFAGPAVNPVYRDGKLYFAAHRCAVEDQDPCNKWIAEVMRIPVGRSSDGSAVRVSTSPADGFFDISIGGESGDSLSYRYPSVEVNKNNDLLIAYMVVGLKSSKPLAAGVRYQVFYHSAPQINDSAVLKDGGPVTAGHTVSVAPDIDLPGIALDPADHLTVWIANAYADSSGSLHAIIGAVKP
ncbi:MAG: hypothetical protein ABJB97_00035 [Acidobacteriota bacterium]